MGFQGTSCLQNPNPRKPCLVFRLSRARGGGGFNTLDPPFFKVLRGNYYDFFGLQNPNQITNLTLRSSEVTPYQRRSFQLIL